MCKKVEFCELNDVPFTIQNMGHYRIDWEKIRSCSMQQKQDMLRFVDKLISLEKSILAGELTLSGLINCFDDYFEKYAISLLINDTRYETISDVLYNFISSTPLSPEVYLKYVIFIRYILEEKMGHHNITMLHSLLMSYLGIDFIKLYFKPERFLKFGEEI